MHRLVPRLALCAALVTTLAAGATVTGCAAFTAALPTIIEGVSDATLIIQQIETYVNAYFAAHPNATLQSSITKGITDVRDALITAEQTLAGASDASSANVAGAFSSFTAAYNALMALVGDIGVKTAPAGTATMATPASLFIAQPQLCRTHPAPAAARRAQ